MERMTDGTAAPLGILRILRSNRYQIRQKSVQPTEVHFRHDTVHALLLA
jgi:hypothetical protein